MAHGQRPGHGHAEVNADNEGICRVKCIEQRHCIVRKILDIVTGFGTVTATNAP